MSWRLLALGISVALAASLLTGPAQAANARTPVRPDGRWLVDGHGRVVLLHGVNSVDKDEPYLDPGGSYTLTESDAEALAAHGFNTVRLGVKFDALMPTEGVIDTGYLDRIAATVELLGEHGIYVLLDHHQDGLSKAWAGGNGFPPWAIEQCPFPFEPNPGFPLYYTMTSMSLGWDEVWHDNTKNVQTHRGNALAAVAERVGDHPAVLGIELMNEPWPGTAWPTCANPLLGCPAFDATMQELWEKLTARVRQADPDLPVYWEPHILWNLTIPSNLSNPLLTPEVQAQDVVFAFHDYCGFAEFAVYLGSPDELTATCDMQHARMYMNLDAVTNRTGWPALATEFGNTEDPVALARSLSRLDARFTGWQYWDYPSGRDLYSREFGKQLVRTYPQATAGEPESMSYNPATGEFHYSYQPEDLRPPTVIFVSPVQYPDGYRVSVSGGTATSRPGARRVTVVADGPTRSTCPSPRSEPAK